MRMPTARYPREHFLRYNPRGNRYYESQFKFAGKENQLMPRRIAFHIFLVLSFVALAPSLRAQIPPAKQSPLVPAQTTQAGCSATAASSCAEAAAKILPIVMSASPLEENLRRVTDENGGGGDRGPGRGADGGGGGRGG